MGLVVTTSMLPPNFLVVYWPLGETPVDRHIDHTDDRRVIPVPALPGFFRIGSTFARSADAEKVALTMDPTVRPYGFEADPVISGEVRVTFTSTASLLTNLVPIPPFVIYSSRIEARCDRTARAKFNISGRPSPFYCDWWKSTLVQSVARADTLVKDEEKSEDIERDFQTRSIVYWTSP